MQVSTFTAWGIGITISVVSLIFGGGWLWKAFRRISRLIDVDDLKNAFVLRSEFDAHVREAAERHQRFLEEYAEPLKDGLRTLRALCEAVAKQTVTLEHLHEDVRDLKDSRRT